MRNEFIICAKDGCSEGGSNENINRIEIMQTHKWKSWRTVRPKVEKAKILDNWDFVKDGRREFCVYKGIRKPSKKEIEVIKILRQMRLTFYKEVSFDMKKRFDFFIPMLDLVIEYDGWHHFQTFKAMASDLEKDKMVKRLGLKILRYTKNDDLGKSLGIDLVKLLAGLNRFQPDFPDCTEDK